VNPVSTSPSFTDPNMQPATTRHDLHVYRVVMAILWTIVIMVLCWLPGGVVHRLEDRSSWFEIHNLDKLIHAGIFVIFSILWARVSSRRRRFGWIALGGFGLAVLTEIVQELPIVGRDGSAADAITDVVGVLAGIAVAPLVEPVARFLESQLFRNLTVTPLPAQGSTVVDDGANRPSK
jgi:VanZ family protein